MKKIFLFCAGLFLFSITIHAQSAASVEDTEHAQETSKGEKMKALLGLSEEQTVKFRAAVTERRAALKAIKEDASLNSEAKEAKTKIINEAREAKFKTIFTPEQFTKWVEYNNSKKKE